jgi:hypothetical protein
MKACAAGGLAARIAPHRTAHINHEKENREMADENKQCANASCSCPADEGEKYCSAYCQGKADTTTIDCDCGCPSCGGNI